MSDSLPPFPLPVLRDGPPVPRRQRRWRGLLLHGLRLSIFVTLLLVVRERHREFLARDAAREMSPVAVDQLLAFYPRAVRTGDVDPELRTQQVLDAAGASLGYVLQTSPDSDSIVGFSGPTNVLLAFDDDDRVAGVSILSSRDTREHVALIRRDAEFLESWDGLDWEEAAERRDVDAVSGATLTSLAISESIVTRLRGDRPENSSEAEPQNLRFPDSPGVDDARTWFADAAVVRWSSERPGLYDVFSADGVLVGRVFRTTPAADGIIGYQGPTDTLVGLDTDDRVAGLLVRKSFDNEPYVGYVRDEEYFLTLFNGKSLDDLTSLDLVAERVEGVSGATMTSMAVAEGLVAAAGQLPRRQAEEATVAAADRATPQSEEMRRWGPSLPDLGILASVVFAAVLALTRLRSHRLLRAVFQVFLIVWLGFWCGALTSLATLFGWAQSGVPWQFAFGLTIVTAAALLFPMLSRTQLYCHHVCPHGALQQLLRNRLPLQWRPRGRLRTVLQVLPFALLIVAVVVTMLGLPFSLVDLEPFDAYVPRAAGIATLTVFVVGILVSLVTPMAYCRFGCPTGAILEFLRFHSSSDRWGRRDWFAVGLLAIAVLLWLLPLPPDEPLAMLEEVIAGIRDFSEANRQTLKWLAIGSAVMFVVSLCAVPWLVGLIPDDYFLTQRRSRTVFRQQHPAVAISLRVVKNVAGAVFLLAGLAMLILPGQGLLTILAGIILLEFPGKRRLERSLIRRKSVLRAVNWIRRRRGNPEIRVD